MKQGWEIKKLGEVCEIQGGSTPKRTESLFWENGTYPWFTVEDIREQGRIITDTKQKVSKIAWDKLRVFPKDTILLCCTASLGEYAITKIPLTSNQQFNGLVIKDKKYLSPMFLMHYCATLKNKLYSLSGKATIDFVSAEKVRQIPIPIPPLPEQERIVAELDCLSGIIEKKKQQLKEYDALAQSIFYEMFGNPIDNEKGWDTAPLKESVIEMFLGPFGSALKTECYVEKNDSFCMVYEQKHAIKKTLELENHYISREKFDELKRFEVHSGDFIMSCRGTIGEIYRLPNDAPIGIIHPSLMKIRIKEDRYNCIFFIRLLSCIIKNENTNGNCVQMAITAKELGARKPILPPLALQQEFASKIEAIEKQNELIKQSIAETETLFNSRMDYYFN